MRPPLVPMHDWNQLIHEDNLAQIIDLREAMDVQQNPLPFKTTHIYKGRLRHVWKKDVVSDRQTILILTGTSMHVLKKAANFLHKQGYTHIYVTMICRNGQDRTEQWERGLWQRWKPFFKLQRPCVCQQDGSLS
ncbi:hypothetical protein [Marinicrinis sediminis]|uniref:Rhodanese domain-containing protein n=1 Tax=Marinicrinis sediminis TaxID=1652465 RepID=A0ABW5RDT0_9BACL